MSFAAASTVAAPIGAATPLAAVDVDAFASRAEAWTAARSALRADAEAQAEALAAEVRQAELDRIAAEELELARQRAIEEAARTTTTTVAPTTTAPPTTTVPPTTTDAPADPPADDGSGDATTTTAAPPTTTTTEPAAEPDPPPGSPTAAQWEVLRQCESSGNYSIVSANGRYRGAYQFSQATWDWIAGIGFPDLVGVDPAQASPADQNAMALLLWQRQGWRPWPICGQQAAAA